MAAPGKRPHEKENVFPFTKKSKGNVDHDRLTDFMNWCRVKKFNLSPKVVVEKERSCAQYGMIATENISEGEVLFEIPRSMLLHPQTSTIGPLLKEESEALASKSGWVPLLLSLMYEYHNENSEWRPYLDLVPDCDELDLPMFWTMSDREKLLSGTGVVESVQKDLSNIETEFKEIVLPFILKHEHKFKSECKNIEFYKKMVAFVMAYSFTEPENETDDDEDDNEEEDSESSKHLPMMVPMADILNHVAKNNAHLSFGAAALKMISVKPILKGEEVFNTYGQLANQHLLHMYGFAEPYPNNNYDSVELSFKLIHTEAGFLDVHVKNKELLEEKCDFLQEQGVIREAEETFIIGEEGVLTDDELHATLKVLTMNRAEFNEHKEKEGWSDDEDEDEENKELLTFGAMKNLLPSWKQLLQRSAQRRLEDYNTTLEQDTEKLASDKLSDRERYSVYLNIGQKQLLKQVINSCV